MEGEEEKGDRRWRWPKRVALINPPPGGGLASERRRRKPIWRFYWGGEFLLWAVLPANKKHDVLFWFCDNYGKCFIKRFYLKKKEEINIKNCCHCRSTAVDCWFWNVVPDSAFTNTAKRENTYVNALLTRTPKLRGRRRRWSPPLEHFDTSPNTQPAGLPAFFRWRWRAPPASMRKHQPFVIIRLACVWVFIFAHLWQKS